MSGQRNALAYSLMFKLTEYVKANYVSSGLTDIDFAEVASKALGFPVVVSNVSNARGALGLLSNYRAKALMAKEKKAVKLAAPVENRNLILDELHSINQGLSVLLRKMDLLLNR